MPTFEQTYPYGLAESGLTVADLKRSLNQRVIVLLGTDDVDVNHPKLRRTPQAMMQGAHRFERGHTFFETAKREAKALNVPFNWQFGHSAQRGTQQCGNGRGGRCVFGVSVGTTPVVVLVLTAGTGTPPLHAPFFVSYVHFVANLTSHLWGLGRVGKGLTTNKKEWPPIPVIAAIYVLNLWNPIMSAGRGRGPNTRPLDTDWWHSNLLLCVSRPVTPTRGPMNFLCPCVLRDGLCRTVSKSVTEWRQRVRRKKRPYVNTRARTFSSGMPA